MKPLYIDTADALARFCARLKTGPFIAVDTEFIRERTYYPQFCLLQAANEEVVACIDPLAIDDLGPFLDLAFDPGITKVFHAGQQDMEIFYHLYNRLPEPVFDTQIAAGLLGYGEGVGYMALVKQMLGVDLAKSHSRTDWTRRPLAPKQLEYAAADVRYLARLYPLQRRRLEELGRLDWLRTDFEALSNIENYTPHAEQSWQRVKGVQKLSGIELAILKELAAWREEQAVQQDKPRRRILADEILIDIARLKPGGISELSSHRGLHSPLVKRYGAELIERVRRGRALPRDQWPQLPRKKSLAPEQQALLDVLSAIVKLTAAENQITASILCTRKDLERLIRGEAADHVFGGWRLELVGRRLEAFLKGGRHLCQDQGRLVLRDRP